MCALIGAQQPFNQHDCDLALANGLVSASRPPPSLACYLVRPGPCLPTFSRLSVQCSSAGTAWAVATSPHCNTPSPNSTSHQGRFIARKLGAPVRHELCWRPMLLEPHWHMPRFRLSTSIGWALEGIAGPYRRQVWPFWIHEVITPEFSPVSGPPWTNRRNRHSKLNVEVCGHKDG